MERDGGDGLKGRMREGAAEEEQEVNSRVQSGSGSQRSPGQVGSGRWEVNGERVDDIFGTSEEAALETPGKERPRYSRAEAGSGGA